MTPNRLLFAALALFVLSGFTDVNKKFSINFPDGWNARVASKDGTVQAEGAAGPTGGYCRANSIALASLKDVSQATLNEGYGQKPIDKATWAGVLTVDPAKIELSESSVKMVDGHPVQITTLIIDASVVGVLTKARFASHIMTGRMVNVGCFAPVGTFDGLRATFDKVIASLKPI